jgi:hypothetical protein
MTGRPIQDSSTLNRQQHLRALACGHWRCGDRLPFKGRVEADQSTSPHDEISPRLRVGCKRSREGEGGGVWDHAALRLDAGPPSPP